MQSRAMTPPGLRPVGAEEIAILDCREFFNPAGLTSRQAQPAATRSEHQLYALADSPPGAGPFLERTPLRGSWQVHARDAPSAVADVTALLGALCRAEPPRVSFSALPEPGVAAAAAVFGGAGYERTHQVPCHLCRVAWPLQGALTRRTAEDAQQLAREGLVVGRLVESDAELVDAEWPHRYPGSLDFVRGLIRCKATSCVRPAGGGAPLSWCLEYGGGAFGMLHTMPEARRRGLARLCTADLVRQLLAAQSSRRRRQERGGDADGGRRGAAAPALAPAGDEDDVDGVEELDVCWAPYCYVVQGNTASLALLTGLGLPAVAGRTFTWAGYTRGTRPPEVGRP